MSTTVRVKPSNKNARPVPPPILLPAYDLLMPPVHFPLYLFFRPSSFSSPANQYVALNLISALADVLEHFPPMAGTIQPDDSGRLHVFSDNRGADFVYEIRKQKFPGEHAENLCPETGFTEKGSPLLAVKLTSFSCGSHVLVMTFCHMLVDLASAMDFIHAFSSQTIGRPLSTVPQQWTRNPLDYFPDHPILADLPGFVVLPPGNSSPPPPPPAPIEQVVFNIPIQKLVKFKSKLDLTISDFQFLAALLWRASATYCLSEKDENDILCLAIAANGRERSPDKTMSKDHYFGNFISDVCVRLTKSELLSEEGLSSVACAIQAELKKQLTVEHIAGKAKTFDSISFDRLVSQIQTRLTSWPKELLDAQDLHFGLVKPGKGKVTVTPGESTPLPVGTLHVMMATEDAYRVQFSVPEGRGDELRMHEELRTLVKFVNDDYIEQGCCIY